MQDEVKDLSRIYNLLGGCLRGECPAFLLLMSNEDKQCHTKSKYQHVTRKLGERIKWIKDLHY